MPKPKELTAEPTLRGTWQTAKKTAEAMAKTAKRTTHYDDMMKAVGKLSFGPDLDVWPGLYPDWPKMEAQKAKIEGVLAKYQKAVGDTLKSIAAKKVDMPKDIPLKLQKALDGIADGLNEQARLAKTAIETDGELGVKQSKEMAKSGGVLTPILVLKHPDISKLVIEKLGDDAKIIKPNTLPVEVIVSDTSILKSLTETPDLRAKAAEAGNFAKVINDIYLAYAKAADDIKKKPDSADAQKAIIQKKVEESVYAAAARASAEIERITKVRTDYRKYQVKCTGEIVLSVAGLVAGIVSISAGPFTGGASVVIGCMALAKGAVDLGTKIGKLSLEAEDFAARLGGRISSLLKRYKDESDAYTGGRELVTTATNAVFPTTFKTISECSGDCGQLGDKINHLEVYAGDVSSTLNDLLDKQDTLSKTLKKWEQESAAVLKPNQVAAIMKVIKKLEDNAGEAGTLIKDVIAFNTRVKAMRTRHRETFCQGAQLGEVRRGGHQAGGERRLRRGRDLGCAWTGCLRLHETRQRHL